MSHSHRALRIQGWMADNFVCHGGLLAVDDLMRQLLPATWLVCVCVRVTRRESEGMPFCLFLSLAGDCSSEFPAAFGYRASCSQPAHAGDHLPRALPVGTWWGPEGSRDAQKATPSPSACQEARAGEGRCFYNWVNGSCDQHVSERKAQHPLRPDHLP